MLAAVRAVPLDSDLLAALDGRPEGRHWSEIITADIVPRLPARWQPEILRRLDAALALEPVPDDLVACMNGRPITNPDGFVRAVVPWLESEASRHSRRLTS